MIFGIHPFAVTPKRMKDDENNELSTNIARLLFPFGANAGQVAVIPKPHNNFKVVPAEMQTFFIKAFSDNVMSRPGAQDWGKLIHKYISEAGDVPMPTPKPAPKPSATSGTAKPRPTGTTTTRPKPKPPVTPQTPPTVPDDESGKKGTNRFLAILGIAVGSVGIFSVAGAGGLVAFYIIMAFLFMIIGIVKRKKQ